MGASTNEELQAQIDAIVRQIGINRGDIDALERRADVSEIRADAADLRADASELRVDEVERRADASDERADAAEAQAAIDRDMIADLQRDGVLSEEHAAQMEDALKSSRTIGAAVGMIMASRDLAEDEAFAVLRTASQKSNRKLRDLAAELVGSAQCVDFV